MNTTTHIRKNVLGMTQSQLAKALNITQVAVSKWEARGLFPSDKIGLVRELCQEKQGADWSDSTLFDTPKDEV